MNKKIALCYSIKHYDPNRDEILGGAGFLAKAIHQLLIRTSVYDEIEYYDNAEIPLKKENYDLLISISNNINKFQRLLKPKSTILFAVNYGAKTRRQISKAVGKHGFTGEILSWADGIYSNIHETDGVCGVVTLGNYSNYLSYLKMGMKEDQVFPISSRMGYEFSPLQGNQQITGKDLIFFPGEISFRKGLSHLSQIVKILQQEGQKRRIRVIGSAPNEYVNQVMRNLVEDFPENILWEDEWVSIGGEVWNRHIRASKFAILPSFEEGIPTSIIELISHGLPVLYSSNCGLDFVSNELVVNSVEVEDWCELICLVLQKDEAFMSKLLFMQKRMLSLLDKDLVQFERVLARNFRQSLWPGLDIDCSLKKRIKRGSWLNSIENKIEYRVTNIDLFPTTGVRVDVLSRKVKSLEELIAIAVTQIDKYVSVDYLVIRNCDEILKVERIDSKKSNSGESGSEDIHLFVFISQKENFLLNNLGLVFTKKTLRVRAAANYRYLRIKNYMKNSQVQESPIRP